MISEAPPIFVPSGPGFKASYSLTFSSDFDHCIHLFGSLQGDAVSAKTLAVDNGSNTAGCTVTLRGKSVPVPAYSVAYVDCEGALDAVISSNSSTAKIAVDVLTYSKPEQIITKKTLNVGGLPPIAITKVGIAYSNASRVLAVGDPVTSYVTLTCTGGSSTNAYLSWGFNSSTSTGRVAINTSYTINMSCENSELWLGASDPNGGAPYANYQLVGG
jgi:spore coat protein U-like protein